MTPGKILRCNVCGQSWSADPEDYPWMRRREYIVCSCGNPLARKEELAEDLDPLLRATDAVPDLLHRD